MQDFQFERLPLFEKLKKGSLKKLKDYAEFRVVEAGKVLVRQGELTEEFYVLIKGLVTVYRNEDDGSVTSLGNLGAGDFFGEMSALSHQPRSATVRADVACVLLEVPPTLFQVLYNDRGGSFETLINLRYRERALATHLRLLPVFRDLPGRVLKRIAKGVELVDFAGGDVILAENTAADSVYLVRSGVIKRVRRHAGGGEEIEAYLCDNSSFGEHSLAEDPRLDVSFEAMARVDAVRVPRELIEETLRGDVEGQALLERNVATILSESQGEPGAERQDLLATEAIKGNEALVIDLERCTRCNVCVESCVAVHEDRVPRLSKRGIRSGTHVLTSACYNCKVPECMLACKFGAIRRDIHGNINFIFDNCTGCTACETKCPYGVIRMADFVAEEAAVTSGSFLRKLPILSRFLAPKPDEEEKRVRKAIKCDLCAGLPFEACVYNCPCQAIQRIDPAGIFSGETLGVGR